MRGDFGTNDQRGPATLKRYTEAQPDGPTGDIVNYNDLAYQGGAGRVDTNNTPEFIAPASNISTFGDNTDNSLDRRFPSEVGCVPIANIIERATTIYWSDGPNGARWSRLPQTLN